MKYRRMPIEEESPEQFGYDRIRYNLTESSVRDRSLADLGIDLGDMVLFYGDHAGNETLRDLVARQSGGEAGGVSRSDVLVTAGAAQALFIIATSLLDKGDHVVVIRPNYATNIETPRAIEADVTYLDLAFEDGYRIDPERLMALVTPHTRYVCVTLPHNPTGVMMSDADLRSLVAQVESAGCRLLVDETYREMTFGTPLPAVATLSERAISVSSLSKTYGIPGVRTGWLVCRDGELMRTFLAAKEQIGICGSVVDEEIAARAFAQRGTWLPELHAFIARQLGVVREWMDGEEMMEWVEPSGGVVCFPRIRPEVPVDVDEFYRVLGEVHGTYVGPGHWFEQDRRHMRIGYAWPLPDELEGGLAAISGSIRAALTI
ncbi:MAG: aminotransferase class I/II-fold pyridoxal phosphate-dependent enzyme [Thermoleophilia bacterium]|nr:aminotransferase class I/II-fold pyridoxal phosphate-dependent enzyme [Thermoleophilia bacterium]